MWGSCSAQELAELRVWHLAVLGPVCVSVVTFGCFLHKIKTVYMATQSYVKRREEKAQVGTCCP